MNSSLDSCVFFFFDFFFFFFLFVLCLLCLYVIVNIPIFVDICSGNLPIINFVKSYQLLSLESKSNDK